MSATRRFVVWRAPLAWLFLTVVLQGCSLFVSHYDAGAYQYFTSLKAYHLKFLEDFKEGPGKTYDDAKVKSVCDTGELKFREATEYAAGKNDDTRIKAISYLHNVFSRNCQMAMKGALLNADFANPQIDDVKKNYDLAIAGESARVGAPTN